MNRTKLIITVGILFFMLRHIHAQNFLQIIQEGKTEELKEILDKNPEQLNFSIESQGNNLLHLSAFFGQMEMVKYLLEEGIEINSVNDYNRNASIFAIAGHHTDILEYLIKQGVSIAHTDDLDRTAMHWCAIQGNAELAELLLKNGADLHAVDNQMKTALHWTARQDLPDVARVLLQYGANPNVYDNHCRTPLFTASWEGHKEIVELLIENHAIVDARYIGAASPLTTAAVADNAEISKYLVENHANVNLVCNMQVTPIYPAIINNNREMVDFYLAHHARINYRDFVGRSPLYIAVRDGYYDIVTMLIEHGADYTVLDESTGRNLLHIAAANGRKEIAALLVEKGIDARATDHAGRTPLFYAGKHGNKELYDYLSRLNNPSGKLLQYDKLQSNHFSNGEGEAVLTKLRHKTWAVSTSDGMLVFGYEATDKMPMAPSMDNGCLAGSKLKDQILYHIDPIMENENPLYDMEDNFAGSYFISSNAYERRYQQNPSFEVENIYFPDILKSEKIKDIEVTALPGFWGAQRSYLIKAGGLNIVWLFQQADRYYPWIKNVEAINYLVEKDLTIDLLFLGNSYSDMGPEWINVMESGYEMAKDLNVQAVFPMPSCKMGEYFYFERQRKGDGDNVYFAKNPGDVFIYKNGKVSEL
jgi:ankyrin repeat protein